MRIWRIEFTDEKCHKLTRWLRYPAYLFLCFISDISAPGEDTKVTKPPEQPKLSPKLVLKKAVQTECDTETVTVAVGKVVLEVS